MRDHRHLIARRPDPQLTDTLAGVKAPSLDEQRIAGPNGELHGNRGFQPCFQLALATVAMHDFPLASQRLHRVVAQSTGRVVRSNMFDKTLPSLMMCASPSRPPRRRCVGTGA